MGFIGVLHLNVWRDKNQRICLEMMSEWVSENRYTTPVFPVQTHSSSFKWPVTAFFFFPHFQTFLLVALLLLKCQTSLTPFCSLISIRSSLFAGQFERRSQMSCHFVHRYLHVRQMSCQCSPHLPWGALSPPLPSALGLPSLSPLWSVFS